MLKLLYLEISFILFRNLNKDVKNKYIPSLCSKNRGIKIYFQLTIYFWTHLPKKLLDSIWPESLTHCV